MKRAALIAAVSLAALLCAGPAGAKPATKTAARSWGYTSLWASHPTAFSPAATTGKAAEDPDRRIAKKQHKERPSEPKGARDADSAPPKGLLHIIVSIDKQRATLFADGEPYATTKISSGTPGHPTPMGVFSVIQKRRHHISNLYDAPMPYMERITWSGSALHEGPLPGYPASHGCVRLTTEFAQLLWKAAKVGSRVIITRDEVKPEPIEHAMLDGLQLNASQAERSPELPTSALVKTVDAGAMAFASARKYAPAAHAEPVERVAEPAPVVAESAPAHAPIMPIISAPAANAAAQQATKVPEADGAGDDVVVLIVPRSVVAERPMKPVEVAAPKAPAVVTPAPIAPEPARAPVPPNQPTKLTAGPAASPNAIDAKPQTTLASPIAKPAVTAAGTAAEAPVIATPKQAEPAPPAPPAAVEVRPAAPAPLIAEEPVAVPAAKEPQAPPSAAAATNRKPVSLFVSLKDRKLYARQGMEALFEMPISIAYPDQPLGTHVFTAMATKDGGGLRWTVVSIPSNTKGTVEPGAEDHRKKHNERANNKSQEPALPLPNAAAALDRIVMPAQAMERIAGLVMPGSSLIVSDNRLSDETNDSTEFIVMTR